jgi:hypothetical protein
VPKARPPVIAARILTTRVDPIWSPHLGSDLARAVVAGKGENQTADLALRQTPGDELAETPYEGMTNAFKNRMSKVRRSRRRFR